MPQKQNKNKTNTYSNYVTDI